MPIIILFFFTVAITYGVVTKQIRRPDDIPHHLLDPMKSMAGFIVMVFPLSQFVAFFNWSLVRNGRDQEFLRDAINGGIVVCENQSSFGIVLSQQVSENSEFAFCAKGDRFCFSVRQHRFASGFRSSARLHKSLPSLGAAEIDIGLF